MYRKQYAPPTVVKQHSEHGMPGRCWDNRRARPVWKLATISDAGAATAGSVGPMITRAYHRGTVRPEMVEPGIQGGRLSPFGDSGARHPSSSTASELQTPRTAAQKRSEALATRLVRVSVY